MSTQEHWADDRDWDRYSYWPEPKETSMPDAPRSEPTPEMVIERARKKFAPDGWECFQVTQPMCAWDGPGPMPDFGWELWMVRDGKPKFLSAPTLPQLLEEIENA